MKKPSLIILVVLLGLGTLLVVQNMDIVTVRFFSFEWKTSKLVLIVASFAAGLFGGLLVSVTGYLRRRIQAAETRRTEQANQKLESDNRDLEAEAANLKAELARLKLKVNTNSKLSEPEKVG